jgi:hypothetical protein
MAKSLIQLQIINVLIVLKVVYSVIILHYKVVQVAEKTVNYLSIILTFLVLAVILNVKSVNMLMQAQKINVFLVQINVPNVLEEIKVNAYLAIITITLE